MRREKVKKEREREKEKAFYALVWEAADTAVPELQ